ncbi:unnamed protein product, partial [Ectocarpus sp. 12 AP-2014]
MYIRGSMSRQSQHTANPHTGKTHTLRTTDCTTISTTVPTLQPDKNSHHTTRALTHVTALIVSTTSSLPKKRCAGSLTLERSASDVSPQPNNSSTEASSSTRTIHTHTL